MSDTYFHAEETVINATARRCYELLVAIRRYAQWWPRVRCETLGPEATLRVGSRFRLTLGTLSWLNEVMELQPWRRIELRYVEGDLLGPVSWELTQRDGATLVRYAYHGVQPNSAAMRQAFTSERGLQMHSDVMQNEVFPGMRRTLEDGHDLSGGDLFEALHTLRSVRRFRPDPVPDVFLRQVIEAATRAPSARNAQPWYFVAVRDPETKRAIAALYLAAWQQAQVYTATVDADADIKDRPGYAHMMQTVDTLAKQLDRAPVLILACLDTLQLGPMADAAGNILAPQSAFASIFPAVQNLMLAARGLGLGSTLTTVFGSVEPEIRAAVGIPPHVRVAALIPLGYPLRPFHVTQRKPVDAVAFLDKWGRKFSDE
jgi:nitroreductase/uncharacterized protein YndB with AHSA1/START domain